MMKIELDHIYFFVENMEKAVNFYETFLIQTASNM